MLTFHDIIRQKDKFLDDVNYNKYMQILELAKTEGCQIICSHKDFSMDMTTDFNTANETKRYNNMLKLSLDHEPNGEFDIYFKRNIMKFAKEVVPKLPNFKSKKIRKTLKSSQMKPRGDLWELSDLPRIAHDCEESTQIIDWATSQRHLTLESIDGTNVLLVLGDEHEPNIDDVWTLRRYIKSHMNIHNQVEISSNKIWLKSYQIFIVSPRLFLSCIIMIMHRKTHYIHDILSLKIFRKLFIHGEASLPEHVCAKLLQNDTLLRQMTDCYVFPMQQQMESTVASTSDANSTSVTTNTEADSTVKHSEVISADITERNATEPSFVPTQLVDRWIHLDTMEWTMSGLNGKQVVVFDLPKDLGKTVASVCDNLVTATWMLNRLQRLEMEVRILCPSQAFLSGLLFAQFFYEANGDADITSRFNKYSMSHNNPVKIRPGGKSEGKMLIPFNNVNAMITNQTTGFDKTSVQHVGKLVFVVVNDLAAGPDVTPFVNVNIQIRFNSKMHGRITKEWLDTPKAQQGLVGDIVNSDVAKPFVETVSEVESMLHSVKRTSNEDKPPNPFSKVVIVPRMAESFCLGTNVDEMLQTLRLDAKGKKPSVLKSKTNWIKHITSDWGLFKQFNWNTSDPIGKELISFPVEPVCDPSEYAVIDTDSGVGLGMPPVDIISSCMTFFSGSLQYLVEFVGAPFHNGSLACAIIPLVDPGDIINITPTLTKTSGVNRKIFEIGKETKDMIITSDYINKNPIMGIKSSDRFATNNRRSMGVLKILVNSILQANTGAAQTVQVNIYKRGSENFEPSIWKNAITSPSFDAPLIPHPQAYMEPSSRSHDWFMGTASAVGPGSLLNTQYGSLHGQFEGWTSQIPGDMRQFTIARVIRNSPAPDQMFRLIDCDLTPATADSVRSFVGGFFPDHIRFSHVLLVKDPNAVGADKFICLPLISQVKSALIGDSWIDVTNADPGFYTRLNVYLWNFQNDPTDVNRELIYSFCPRSSVQGTWMSYFFDQPRSGVFLEDVGQQFLGTQPFEQQTGDLVASNTVRPPVSTNFGMRIFGEEGGEITDILRRPQYVGKFSYNPSTARPYPYSHVAMRVSHYQPPTNYSDPAVYSNRWSLQSLLMTGFLFVSGSMNVRILGPKIENVNMWCQHKHYDKPHHPPFITSFQAGDIRNNPTIINGPALDIISLDVNPCANLNVPWYQENVRNLLARQPLDTDESYNHAYDIGKLHIGFSSNTTNVVDKEFPFLVFFSYGDDAEISGYRGFPPMVFTSELEYEPNRKQQGMLDGIIKKTYDATGIAEQIEDIRKELHKEIKEAKTSSMTAIFEKFDDSLKHIAEISGDIVLRQVASILAGETLHLIANPNKKTILVSFINVFVQLGFFSMNVVSSLMSEIESLIGSNQPEQDRKQQAEGPEDTLGSIISLLVSSICSYIGWTNPVVKTVPWATRLAFAIPGFVGGAWSLKRFMTSFMPMFKWLFEQIMRLKVSICDNIADGFLSESRNMIENWISEVNKLTAVGISHDDMDTRNRVSVAHAIGQVIEKKVIQKSSQYGVFKDYIRRIRELNDKIIADGHTPYIRKEPFCIWLYGVPGIGKSHLIDNFTTKLIKDNKILVPGEKTLMVTPTSKFLNRIKGQPELRIDDFMAVTSAEAAATQLSYIFDVMTCAPYIPNQAKVEAKDQLYAPFFLSICGNSFCPNQLPVANMDAFLRRRHVTIQVHPNTSYLEANFGEEFKTLRNTPGFIYGNLPKNMTEGNKHLYFVFMTAKKGTSTPEVMTVHGRQEHTYDETVKILDEAYKKHQTKSTASYKSRLINYWSVRNQEVPDFLDILDANSEPSLAIIIRKWIAEFEKDDKTLRLVKGLLKDFGYNNDNPVHNIIQKYYECDKKQQGILDEKQDISEFVAKYPDTIQDQVTKLLEGVEYDSDDGFTTNVGDCDIPLAAFMLQHAKCSHKVKFVVQDGVQTVRERDAIKVLETIMDDTHCTDCWVVDAAEVSQYLLTCVSTKERNLIKRVSDYITSIASGITHVFTRAAFNIKRAIKIAFEKIKCFGVSIWDFLKKHWLPIGAAVTASLGIYYTLIKDTERGTYLAKLMPDGTFLTKAGKPYEHLTRCVEKFSHTFGRGQQAYNPKIHIKSGSPESDTRIRAQQSADNTEQALTVIRDAYALVEIDMNSDYIARKGKNTFSCHGFCFGNRKMLMTMHEWEIITKFGVNFKVILHNKDQQEFAVNLNIDAIKVFEMEHYHKDQYIRHGNFVILEMPKQFPPRRSLVRHVNGKVSYSYFQGEKDLNSGMGCLVIPPKRDGGMMRMDYWKTRYSYSKNVQVTSPIDINGEAITSRTSYDSNYMYPIEASGYCSAALVDLSTNKILGFHYCGGGKIGVAEKMVTDYFMFDDYNIVIPEYEEPNTSFDAIEGAIWPIGHVKEKKQQNGETNITKSIIHGTFPVTTEPAILSPKDERNTTNWSPLYTGVTKHGKPCMPFPKEHLDESFKDLRTLMRSIEPIMRNNDGTLPVITVEQAIFGIPGYLNSMDFTTSLGYGWSGKGKRSVVNPETKWISPEFKQRLEKLVNDFANNTIPFVISVDCLKDETRPIEKLVKPGSTRIISTFPFEYQVLLRMVTSNFIIAHQANNFRCEHAIGISVCGPKQHEFDILGKMMEKKNIVAGDFSNFGPGADAEVASLCLDIIADWHEYHGAPVHNKQIIRAILEVLINSVHLAHDKLYRTVCGIISGSGITTPLNSMIHSMYIRLASLGMGISLPRLHENVTIITYGDDGLLGVKDNLISEFNLVTLQEFFAKHGIKYTNASKDETMGQTHNTLEEATFLKHNFILRNSKYHAALDKNSIENQLNWISKDGDQLLNTIINIENALRQSYAHGREYYENIRDLSTKALTDKGYYSVFNSYNDAEIDNTFAYQYM